MQYICIINFLDNFRNNNMELHCITKDYVGIFPIYCFCLLRNYIYVKRYCMNVCSFSDLFMLFHFCSVQGCLCLYILTQHSADEKSI